MVSTDSFGAMFTPHAAVQVERLSKAFIPDGMVGGASLLRCCPKLRVEWIPAIWMKSSDHLYLYNPDLYNRDLQIVII